MTNKQFIKTYKHVYFRLRQDIYQWGKGWIISNEAIEEFEAEVKQLIKILNMVEVPEDMKVCRNSSTSAVRFYEGLYFHPMDFSGAIHKDNIENYNNIISNFKSKYFSVERVDTFDFSEENLKFYVIRNNEQFEKITHIKYSDMITPATFSPSL